MKKKLTCKEIAKHICGELDEQIHSAKCRAVKRHLDSCPDCQVYLDSIKKTIRLYSRCPGPPLSSKCKKELYTMLRRKK